jgi:hypothetical protein
MLLLLALAAAACAHAKPPTAADPQRASAARVRQATDAVEVEDAIHGVRYELPPSADGWQGAREGNAHVAGGVQVEVASFPMARTTSAAACRDLARSKLTGTGSASRPSGESSQASPPREDASRESGQGNHPRDAAGSESQKGSDTPGTASRLDDVDGPRDQTTGDSPTATWSFSRGPSTAPVRSRWAFYPRAADCVMLEVSGPVGDAFSESTFLTAAGSFQVLPLPPERQREVDLLAGMGFLERRDPASALERFEALTQREPGFAKAHFGALMAGFELGQPAYARSLPHGVAALQAERELTSEQRQLALRAVGVMQLAQNDIHRAVDTLAELVVRAPDLAEGQYNYACALARSGDAEGSLEHLRAALRLDGDLASHARDDEDFKALRSNAAFQQLVATPPPSSAESKPPPR